MKNKLKDIQKMLGPIGFVPGRGIKYILDKGIEEWRPGCPPELVLVFDLFRIKGCTLALRFKNQLAN